MILFSAKSDLGFMELFQENVNYLFELKSAVRQEFEPSVHISGVEYLQAVTDSATTGEDGKKIRKAIAQSLMRASEIASKYGVSHIAVSYPAPAVGGPVINQDILYATIQDTSHCGIDEQTITDTIDQTIGAVSRQLSKDKINIFNPLYWLYSVLVFVIRIPFILVSISGFNVSVVENHIAGKIFKLVEMILVGFLLLKLGDDKIALLKDVISVLKGSP
jgi:hypothetical protein